MKSIGPIKLVNAILCDDVRREANNNKYILIGTYSGQIRLGAAPPVGIHMALYIELDVPAGEHELDVRLSGPGRGSAILQAKIKQDEAGTGIIATPRMEILLEREGVFRVDARFGGGHWVNLIKKRVFHDPSIVPALHLAQSPPDVQEAASQPEPSRPDSPRKRRPKK